MPYIPENHKKYNLLPYCVQNGGEVFEYPNLDYVHNLLEGYDIGGNIIPYGYRSYDEYFAFIDDVDSRFSRRIIGLHTVLLKLKSEIKHLNKKEEWSVCKYIGENTDNIFGLTKGQNYYWPTTTDNPKFCGVIDDEEFTAYIYSPKSEDWEILEDPTGMAKRAIELGEKTILERARKLTDKEASDFESILNNNKKNEDKLKEIEKIQERDKFDGYSDFDLQIKFACEDFYAKHDVLPNAILVSIETAELIQSVIDGKYKGTEKPKYDWNEYLKNHPDEKIKFGGEEGADFVSLIFGKDIKVSFLINNELAVNDYILTSSYIYDFENSVPVNDFKKDGDGFPEIKAFELIVKYVNELEDGSAVIEGTNGDYTPIYFLDRKYCNHKEKYGFNKKTVVRLVGEIESADYARTYTNKSIGFYGETPDIRDTALYEFEGKILQPYVFDEEDLSNGKQNGFFMKTLFFEDDIPDYPENFMEAVFVNKADDSKIKENAFIHGTMRYVVYDNIFEKYHKYGRWYSYWTDKTQKVKRFASESEIKSFLRKKRAYPILGMKDEASDEEIDIKKYL